VEKERFLIEKPVWRTGSNPPVDPFVPAPPSYTMPETRAFTKPARYYLLCILASLSALCGILLFLGAGMAAPPGFARVLAMTWGVGAGAGFFASAVLLGALACIVGLLADIRDAHR
jgi:hypothetical protein